MIRDLSNSFIVPVDLSLVGVAPGQVPTPRKLEGSSEYASLRTSDLIGLLVNLQYA
jgi:hypothetical protein